MVLAIAALGASGCLDRTGDEAGDLGHSTEGASAATPVDPLPRREAILNPLYSVSISGMGFVDMNGGVAEVEVPDGADWTNVTFAWSSLGPLGQQHSCMLHEGRKDAIGDSLANVDGPSPLRVSNVTVPIRTTWLSVMCVAAGSPADAEALPQIHVVAEFGRAA